MPIGTHIQIYWTTFSSCKPHRSKVFFSRTACVRACFSRSVVSNALQLSNAPESPGSSLHGIFQARIPKRGCHFFLHGTFLAQGSNSRLLHLCIGRWDSLLLSHQGSKCIIAVLLNRGIRDGILFSRVCLAVSGDIFGCCNWGGRCYHLVGGG